MWYYNPLRPEFPHPSLGTGTVLSKGSNVWKAFSTGSLAWSMAALWVLAVDVFMKAGFQIWGSRLQKPWVNSALNSHPSP